jgi:trigger factor
VTVTKEIAKLEHSSIKLTLTIGKDDVRSEYDALLSEYTKNIQVPGFRKGKVPKNVLIRKFGNVIKDDALGRIIEKSISAAFEDEEFPKENRPLPYSTPQVEDKPVLDPEKDLIFSVIYEVLPQINVEKWQGLEAEVPDVAITEEDINRELEAVRERNAIVMDKDDGEAAAKDDVVTIDYCELGDDGAALPDSERQDFVFTLGSGLNIYKLDDDIPGMKKGETREFVKTYLDDAEDKTLAGKTVKLRVTLTALKIKKLPNLDDDLAQDVDEKFNTLEDLKQSIRERLDQDLDRRIREIKISKLLEKIMESTPADIPETMIRLELDSRWRNLARRFGTDSDGLYKMMGSRPESPQGILDSWKPDAVKALHSRLIVESLIRTLKIEAGDEEVEKEIESQAAESGMPLEDYKKYYEKDQMKEYLKDDIKERKFFDRFIAENTIKPGKKQNYLDLVSNNG